MVIALPGKRARFVEEYLVDFNGTQAAIRAGYSARTAYSQASRLLNDVKVQAELERRRRDLIERTELSQDRVLEEVRRLAFHPIQPGIHSASQKIRALELLGRYLGMWDGKGGQQHETVQSQKIILIDRQPKHDKSTAGVDVIDGNGTA